jgi:plasmid stabilization system protein ParE
VKLVFDEKALADLEGIYNWIAQDNPVAAKAIVEWLLASVPGVMHLALTRLRNLRI